MAKLQVMVDLEKHTAKLTMDGEEIHPESLSTHYWRDMDGKPFYSTSWSMKLPDGRMVHKSVQFEVGQEAKAVVTIDAEDKNEAFKHMFKREKAGKHLSDFLKKKRMKK